MSLKINTIRFRENLEYVIIYEKCFVLLKPKLNFHL